MTTPSHALADKVAALESRYGPIPQAYRRLVLTGVRPRRSGFNVEVDGEIRSGSIDGLLSVDDGWLDLREILEVYANRYPPDLFPIATTSRDDLILVARDDSPRAGRVFFWDHDGEADDGDEPDDRNVYLIADSLEVFLAGLHD